MDDIFFDATSSLSNIPSPQGEGFGRASGRNRGSDETMNLYPSFASLGSLHNVDESSGSEEDDLVTAAADEGYFAVPGTNRPYGASPTPGRSPSPAAAAVSAVVFWIFFASLIISSRFTVHLQSV